MRITIYGILASIIIHGLRIVLQHESAFDSNWSVDTIRPFVLHAIDVFSAERCMFGSNFPVDGMMSSYTRLWSAYSEITGDFSANERYALFCGNAERIYRI